MKLSPVSVTELLTAIGAGPPVNVPLERVIVPVIVSVEPVTTHVEADCVNEPTVIEAPGAVSVSLDIITAPAVIADEEILTIPLEMETVPLTVREDPGAL